MVVSDEFIEQNSWMVRPCLLYDEEYSDCTSIRARFNQHFVHGRVSDCSSWKRDYNNCCQWTEKQNRKAFKELIDSELARRKERIGAHCDNDIWEKRKTPPSNWNDPLPKHIEERIQNSYLAAKERNLREGTTDAGSSVCVIS